MAGSQQPSSSRRERTSRTPTEAWVPLFDVNVFFSCVAFSIIVPSLALYLRRMGAPQFVLGVAVAIYSLGEMIGSTIFGAWMTEAMQTSPGRGPKIALLVTISFGLVGSSLYVVADACRTRGAPTFWGPALVVLARLLSGVWTGGKMVVEQTYIGEAAAPSRTTQITSEVGVYAVLGFVVGPSIGAVFSGLNLGTATWRVDEYTAPGYFMALLCVLMLIATYVVFDPMKGYHVHPSLKASLSTRRGQHKGNSSSSSSEKEQKPSARRLLDLEAEEEEEEEEEEERPPTRDHEALASGKTTTTKGGASSSSSRSSSSSYYGGTAATDDAGLVPLKKPKRSRRRQENGGTSPAARVRIGGRAPARVAAGPSTPPTKQKKSALQMALELERDDEARVLDDDAGRRRRERVVVAGGATGDQVDDDDDVEEEAEPDRRGLALLLFCFLAHFYSFAIQETVTTPFVAARFGWSQREIDYLFAGVGLLSLATSVFVAYLSQCYSDVVLLVLSLVFGLAGSLLLIDEPLGPDLSEPRFLVGFALITVAFPFGRNVALAMFSKVLGPTPQGNWMGLMFVVGALPRCLGPSWALYALKLACVVFPPPPHRECPPGGRSCLEFAISSAIFAACLVLIAPLRLALLPYHQRWASSSSSDSSRRRAAGRASSSSSSPSGTLCGGPDAAADDELRGSLGGVGGICPSSPAYQRLASGTLH